MTKYTNLSEGSITGHILRMTPPMAGALFAMMAFNLADTWFVSRLGTVPLAAMGFTFPIVMLVHAVSMGLGIGTSACVSRGIGQKDFTRVRMFATYSLILTFCVTSLITLIAWLIMEPMFRAIGSTGETLRPDTELHAYLVSLCPNQHTSYGR